MEKVIFWGTGKIAEKYISMNSLLDDIEVIGVVDNNIRANLFHGYTVYSPEQTTDLAFDTCVILSSFYSEIKDQIAQLWFDKTFELEKPSYLVKRKIQKRYDRSNDEEIQEIIDYLSTNDLEVFNYEFAQMHQVPDEAIMYDDNVQMFYVCYNNRNMYFKRSLDSLEKVKKYYRSLLIEQDIKSPHQYLDDTFDVKHNGVVVDAGVAEGIFSLDVIDKSKKVYLIECDEEWIEALKYTFQNDMDKVEIINKYVTSISDDKNATLDTLIQEEIDFLKMDIEGAEIESLLGANNHLKNDKSIKCAICSYHNEDDEYAIKQIMEDAGIKCCTTRGYMWFPAIKDNCYSTKLSRGIVRGRR